MGSNLSNSPSSSNSFIDRTNHPIHRQLWMHKAHNGKPKLLINFVEKFMGTVRFGNDQLFNLHLFLDTEIWFKEMSRSKGFTTSKASIIIYSRPVNFVMQIWRLLSENLLDLLDIFRASPTQTWLWHCYLSHLKFDTINLLSKNDIVNGLQKLKYVCSSCEMGKAKRSNFKTKIIPSSKG
nr:hypothetical protein [Tanacetum cinerariifolium]